MAKLQNDFTTPEWTFQNCGSNNYKIMEEFKDLLAIAAGVILGMVIVYSLVQFVVCVFC